MFKKSLVAVAVLGAAALSAQAADVQLYGLVDLGLNWTHTEDADGVKTDKFSMTSGQNSGSRFGLKGTEDLGNGYTVGFVLENAFNADAAPLIRTAVSSTANPSSSCSPLGVNSPSAVRVVLMPVPVATI